MWNELGPRQTAQIYEGLVLSRNERLAEYTKATFYATRGEGTSLQDFIDKLTSGGAEATPQRSVLDDEIAFPEPPQRDDLEKF